MEKHIKQRIYSIRKKESTDGYKYSKLGVIPIDWTIKEIKDIATINPQKTLLQNEKMVSFLGMAGVSENAKVIELETKPYGEVSKGFTSFIDNDILVAKITPCFENGKGALVKNLINGVGFGSTEFHVIRCEKPEDIKFVFYHTTSHRFRKTGEKNMTGTAGQKRVPADFIENYLIQYPSNADERAKIAEVLSTWDKAIELKEKLIDEKKKQKAGLMQKLLTGNVRFTGFNDAWEEVKFGKVFKFLNKERVSEPQNYKLLTVKLHLKGIEATEKYPNDTKNGRPYYLREPNEILIGRQNYHNGGIGIVPSNMKNYIASNAISSLTTIKGDLMFLFYYISNVDFYKRVGHMIGGTGQKEISETTMKNLVLRIPKSLEEQKKIGEVLKTADNEIDLLEKELESLKQQKKGLMQLLLTGIIRVNTQENEKR